MINKLAYWIGDNRELNRRCREYIRQYSGLANWDVVLFSDNQIQEPLAKYPSYTMYDYDGLIIVDSIEKLSKTEELFGAKSLLYVWEDNWGTPTNYLEKMRVLGGSRVITRNALEADKFKSVWGLSSLATILYPDPKEFYNVAV